MLYITMFIAALVGRKFRRLAAALTVAVSRVVADMSQPTIN